jgi:hypothetical protein
MLVKLAHQDNLVVEDYSPPSLLMLSYINLPLMLPYASTIMLIDWLEEKRKITAWSNLKWHHLHAAFIVQKKLMY